MYNNGAYDSARYSKGGKEVKEKISKNKKVLQEESKALGGAGPGMNFSGTMAGSYIEMKAPEWLCSVICAGFEVDDILDDARAKATTPVLTSLNTNFNTIISTSQEEQDVLNVNKNQINSVA